MSVTAPLPTLTNPDAPAPFNIVSAQETEIEDFEDAPAEVGPVATLSETEISQNEDIADLQQEVFELQNENATLTGINEELSAQDFVGITETELNEAIDGVVSTIIGAIGDGGLLPEQYDNPGPLTPEQLAAIDSVITNTLDEARDEGADSVDFEDPDTLNNDQQAQLTTVIDNAAADFDLTDTDGFTLEQQNQFDQIQAEAVTAFGNTPFEELTPDQQDIYTGIEESNDAQIAEEATLQAEGDYTAGYDAGQASVDTDAFYNEGFIEGQASVDIVGPYNQGFNEGVDSVDLDDESTLTPDQIFQLETIQATAEATGAASVDIESDNQQVYDEAFDAGQAAVDLTDTGSLTDQQRDQLEAIQDAAEEAGLQSFSLNQLGIIATAQAEGVPVNLQGYSQAQIDAYNLLTSTPASDFEAIRSAFADQNISSAEAETLFNRLYQVQGKPRQTDVNQDGNVSTADLLEFLTAFGADVGTFVVPTFIPGEFLITPPDTEEPEDPGI